MANLILSGLAFVMSQRGLSRQAEELLHKVLCIARQRCGIDFSGVFVTSDKSNSRIVASDTQHLVVATPQQALGRPCVCHHISL